MREMKQDRISKVLRIHDHKPITRRSEADAVIMRIIMLFLELCPSYVTSPDLVMPLSHRSMLSQSQSSSTRCSRPHQSASAVDNLNLLDFSDSTIVYSYFNSNLSSIIAS